MTIKSIPLSALGRTYRNFEDAPPGAILAYGSRVVTGQGNNWQESEGELIALRLDTEVGPALQVILPEPKLIFARKAANTMMAQFSAISVTSGAALDVTNAARLAVNSFRPRERAQGAELEAGNVAVLVDGDPDRLLLAIDYPGYANKMLVLRGEGVGTIIDIGAHAAITLGKLTVEPISSEAQGGGL